MSGNPGDMDEKRREDIRSEEHGPDYGDRLRPPEDLVAAPPEDEEQADEDETPPTPSSPPS
jgi:hypothetical protein